MTASTTGSGAAASPRKSPAIAASSGSGDDLPSAGVISSNAFLAAVRISSALGGGSGCGRGRGSARAAWRHPRSAPAWPSGPLARSCRSTARPRPAASGRSRADKCRGGGRVRGQDVDRERVGHRRIHQIVEGPHRLGVRVLGVQRIGVEAQPRQQGDAEHGQQRRTAPARGRRRRRTIVVERRRPAKADLGAFAARPEKADRRRQKGHGAQETRSASRPRRSARARRRRENRSAQRRETPPRWPPPRPGSGRRPAGRSRPSRRRGRGIPGASRDSARRTGSRNRPRCRQTGCRSRPRPGSGSRPPRRRTAGSASARAPASTGSGRSAATSAPPETATARSARCCRSGLSTAPLATLANSSSASATLPVMRTRASPDLTNSSLLAAARIAAVAAPPGSSAPLSSRGWASTNL